MASLDQILNIVIPAGIFIFFGVIIFKPFRHQIANFWDWLMDKFEPKVDKGGDPSGPHTIIYER